MSTNKNINKICIAVVAVTLVITILFMCGEPLGLAVKSKAVKYESTIFDTSYVHSIDIVMNDPDSFIENCENEEYTPCTVVIDGKKHSDIAIRAKGNTSLSSVKSMGSQRYSFKLEFDHYEDAKTLDGLDKLCLNNLIQDNTMMKDYLAYMMMDDFGVDSPLCSFAYLTINGEDRGLYLAVEGIEDSFLSRNYGSDSGELYKPDSMSFGGGRGNGKDFRMDDFDFGDRDNDSETKSDRSMQAGSRRQSDSDSEGKTAVQSVSLSFTGKLPGGRPDSGTGGPPDMPGFSGGDRPDFPNGEMPDFPNGEMPDFPNGEMPDFPNGEMPDFPNGEMPDFPNGEMPDFPNGELPELPAEESAASSESETTEPVENNIPGFPGGGMPDFGNLTDEEKSAISEKFGGGFGGFGGMGSDDVKLKYIDDNADSYSNIFDNAKTAVSAADKKRLINSLKNLSSYTDFENTLDTDEVLRYFVVHNFVCNGDSYTGAMIHNYYLHESDGKLGMIPWDYNLAFGTFQGGSASGSVNASIDSPVTGGNVDDRPMLGWIFSDESHIERYHKLFSEFIDKWFTDGELEKLISDTAEMIRPYVEKDPTKFCTVEEFEKGVSAISQFVSLRAEAVTRQLSGDDAAVETGDLNISDMGTMGGGPGKGNRPSMPGSQSSDRDFSVRSGKDSSESADSSDEDGSEPKSFDKPDFQAPDGEDGQRSRPQMPGKMPDDMSSSSGTVTYIMLGISVLVLALGLLIVICRKSRNTTL